MMATAAQRAWAFKAMRVGLSQADVARRLGVAQSTVCRWLRHAGRCRRCASLTIRFEGTSATLLAGEPPQETP